MDKTERVSIDSLYTTSISLAELKFGAYKSDQIQSNLKNVENLARGLSILPFNKDASEHYGRIKARLSDAGSIIEDMDILIASIALANEGILVTNNTAHFNRVKDLNLENWVTKGKNE